MAEYRERGDGGTTQYQKTPLHQVLAEIYDSITILAYWIQWPTKKVQMKQLLVQMCFIDCNPHVTVHVQIYKRVAGSSMTGLKHKDY